MRRKHVRYVEPLQRRMCCDTQQGPKLVNMNDLDSRQVTMDVFKKLYWKEQPLLVSKVIRHVRIIKYLDTFETALTNHRYCILVDPLVASGISRQHGHFVSATNE